MNQAEKELRQQQFDCFKANYEYYDLTPSKEKIQAFERYVSGEIDAEQLQRIFHNLSGSTENFIMLPMDWFC
ncbi:MULTISPECIES: hypothetical protein [Acinetobacter]|jgi:hypothetical protein|uniref:hypothetical protein n=1 Tax=Acinetobacter TaxID=469 RepID=UPI0018DE3266|nr:MULTISPECIES: hypothetical protein [Acinetobacter]MBH8252494.1 hypothetical protein [Acinetobacter baumannii]MEB3839195.1 hypothetical protein [Acinetobacter sp. IK25]HEF0011077.1 hypothetical protein [Citrobacter braakii]